MTPEQFQEVEALFESLLERPPEERRDRLEGADCDPEIRDEVSSLLTAHDRPLEALEGTLPGERLRPDGQPQEMDERPTTLGPYTLDRELGRGGMGEVFLAHDSKLEREVAIKVLPRRLRNDPGRRRRFLREAQSAAKLSHPNVTQVFEIGEVDGHDFIALEYVEGDTLEKVLSTRHLAAEEIFLIALPVADALGFAHERGIVHRDLKPANVMVSKRGHPKLLDFGLAKILDEHSQASEGEPGLTLPGAVFGTPCAMSPEQALGRVIDARSDVFSFGSLLYEMATGRAAFPGQTTGEIVDAVINADPTPADRDDLPVGLSDVIERALRKDPEERYQSMTDLSADLLEVQRRSQSGVVATGSAWRPHWNRRALLVSTLVFVVALGLLALGLLAGSRHTPIDRIAVLPLDNLTQDEQERYFVDGMHEALINAMGTLDGVAVLSRRSVMKYRGSVLSLEEIASELGVNGVVEGSVFRAGDSVRISVRLVRGATEGQVWSSSYEGSVSEALNVQRQVARSIAGAIEGALSPEVEGRLAARPPVASAAQEAYLRGQYLMRARTLDGMARAIEYFDEAVRLQDDFAEGYAGLAKALYLSALYVGSQLPREEIVDRSIRGYELATHALELDPNLAEAHAIQAYALMGGRYFEGAERGLRRAIEINPSHAQAHNWLGDFLLEQARIDEGLREQQLACALDPSSAVFAKDLGRALFLSERYAEAVTSSELALELEPELGHGRRWLICALVQLERFEEAWEVQREDLVLRGASAMLLAESESAFREGGWKQLMSRLLDVGEGELTVTTVDPDYIFKAASPQLLAIPLTYVGRIEEALTALELAVASETGFSDGFEANPMLAPLREEPRYLELLREVRAAR